jgi:hypothetical protein
MTWHHRSSSPGAVVTRSTMEGSYIVRGAALGCWEKSGVNLGTQYLRAAAEAHLYEISWRTSNLVKCIWLVVWKMIFFIQLRIVTPTDELIFFRGVGIPPTRYYSILFPLKCWYIPYYFILFPYYTSKIIPPTRYGLWMFITIVATYNWVPHLASWINRPLHSTCFEKPFGTELVYLKLDLVRSKGFQKMQNFEDLSILNWFFLCRSVSCHRQLQVSSICHRSFPTSCQVRPSRWPVVGIRPVKMSWKSHGNVMKKLPDISMLMLGVVEWKWMKVGVESLKLLGSSWQYDLCIFTLEVSFQFAMD